MAASSTPPPTSNIPTITGNIFPSATDVVRRETTTVTVATNTPSDRIMELKYSNTKILGNGSFGVVYVARLVGIQPVIEGDHDSGKEPDQEGVGELIAIKKVLQDKRYKNRELQIMRKLDHQNVVKLRYFFALNEEANKDGDIYLSLLMEYLPETIYRLSRNYSKQRIPVPQMLIRLYTLQLFRALAYIHQVGVCHRDIKPQNLLINPDTGVLKLCDFGSAKVLVRNEPNVSYICSRYYRAPELIFGSTTYTNSIDVWSAGTVMAELMLGRPIFPGESGVDQLVEVIKLLGTPTREQIQQMNPNYKEFRFPSIKAHPWAKVFRVQTPLEAVDLIGKLLEYNPAGRLSPLQACAHPYFDELRKTTSRLPNGQPLPPQLFNFSEQELAVEPQLQRTQQQPSGGGDSSQASSSSASAGTTTTTTTPSPTTIQQQQQQSNTIISAGEQQ